MNLRNFERRSSVKHCDYVERPINRGARLRDCCLVFLNEPPEKGQALLILDGHHLTVYVRPY